MLVIAILVLGVILIGALSLQQHSGHWARATVDTCAWLLIAIPGVGATHFWPRNELVLVVTLLIGLMAATLLRRSIKTGGD